MKSLICSVCLITIFATAFAQETGDSWQKVKTTKSGTMLCIWNEAYGIVYKDEKGILAGVCIDILEDFRVYVNNKYSVSLAIDFVEEKSFSRFLDRVEKSGTLLGVSTVSVTEERKKRFQFSPYFVSNPTVLVSHKDAPKLTSLAELATVYKKFPLMVIKGTTHKNIAASLKSKYAPELIITEAATNREVFNELRSNKEIFTIMDFGEFLGASKNKLPIVRQPVNLEIEDKLAFLMSKSSDWEPLWREFLTSEYRKSPGYRKIISENLGLAYLGMIQ